MVEAQVFGGAQSCKGGGSMGIWLIVSLLFVILFLLIHLISAIRELRIWIELEVVDRIEEAGKGGGERANNN